MIIRTACSSRRGFLTLGAGLGRRRSRCRGLAPAFAATAAKPASLNMLYATSEADSDAIKAALARFQVGNGLRHSLSTRCRTTRCSRRRLPNSPRAARYYDIMIVDTPWMPALTNKIEPITDMVLDSDLSADLDLADFIPKVFFDTAVFKRDASHCTLPASTRSILRRSRRRASTSMACRSRPTY